MTFKVKFFSWTAFSAYAIANGLIYSWSFWNKFNINILQYASINDLLPSIVFSILIPTILILLGIILSYVYAEVSGKITTFFLNALERIVSNKINLDLGRFHKNLDNTVSIIGSIIVLLIVPYDIKLIVGLLMASILGTYYIKEKTNILSEFGTFRPFVLLVLTLMPYISYEAAQYNSSNIIDGKNTFIVKSDSPCITKKNKQYRYIATISDKTFAMSTKDKSICIFKYNFIELIPESDSTFIKSLPINRT